MRKLGLGLIVGAVCAFASMPAFAGPYEDGKAAATAENYGLAVYWLKKAADVGHTEAQFDLAVLYLNGHTSDAEAISKGIAQLRRAADAGLLKAQTEMAVMFIMGGNYGVSLEEQNKYLRMAADQGHARSQFRVGRNYESAKEYSLARLWYNKAIAQGQMSAKNALAKLDEKSRKLQSSVVSNPSPIQYPYDSKQYPYVSREQMKRWGVIFDDGIKVYNADSSEQALKDVISRWTRLAEKGDLGSQVAVGVAYNTGRGVPYSSRQALKWFERASQNDSPQYLEVLATTHKAQAEINLAIMYTLGKGVAKDSAKSMFWLKRAAKHESADAQGFLGDQYYGQTPPDLPKAFLWWEKAALQGQNGAQFNLGLMYLYGESVPVDKTKALYWFKKAVKNGNKNAAPFVEQLQ